MIRLFTTACLAMSIGCSPLPMQPIDNATLLGMTVSKAISDAGITLERQFVIDEPPCVPRGISGHDKSGNQIELYVKRGDVPFSISRKWTLEQFQNKIVIGVAKENDEKWTVVGDVMLIREMGATRLPTKASEQDRGGNPHEHLSHPSNAPSKSRVTP